MTTEKELRSRAERMENAARAFLETDWRVRHGELRPWGRAYKRAINELRQALEENYGASS